MFLELNGNELLLIRQAPKKYELRTKRKIQFDLV